MFKTNFGKMPIIGSLFECEQIDKKTWRGFTEEGDECVVIGGYLPNRYIIGHQDGKVGVVFLFHKDVEIAELFKDKTDDDLQKMFKRNRSKKILAEACRRNLARNLTRGDKVPYPEWVRTATLKHLRNPPYLENKRSLMGTAKCDC